jgi:hypothetical protein
MSLRLSRGTLTISIALDCQPSLDVREHRLEATVARLLETLSGYQIPATWAVDEPAASPATAAIRSVRGGHEIAIGGHAGWLGNRVPRTQFGRELASRTIAARAEGLTVSSLVVAAGQLGDHYDLMIKQGLSAIQQAELEPARSSARRGQPATPRFGLWSFGVSCRLPGGSRLWPGGGGTSRARRAIDRAIRDRALVQLLIDARELASRGSSAERVVERVLQHAAQRRRSGQLDVITLASTAKLLTDQCTSRPSRSILRPAA